MALIDDVIAMQDRLLARSNNPVWLLEAVASIREQVEAGAHQPPTPPGEITYMYPHQFTYEQITAGNSFFTLLARYGVSMANVDPTDEEVAKQLTKLARWAHMTNQYMTKDPPAQPTE